MDNFFENDYVRVGLPVLMGVAAASSPAGARGAGAMLSSLGAMQGIAEGKERREGERVRASIQRLKLEQEERQAKQPKIEYRDGQWYAIHPEGKITPTGVMSGDRQGLEDILSGKTPLPGHAAAPQPTGLGGSLSPDIERMVSEAERNVQAQIPGAQVFREGPATPPSVDPGTRAARARALVNSPDGPVMIYLSGDANLIKYLENSGKDQRELDMARKRADIELERQKALVDYRYPKELEISRQQQAGAARTAADRQAAMRTEEMQARERMSLRQAADNTLVKDPQRYFNTTTGEPVNAASTLYTDAVADEAQGKIRKIEDDTDYKQYAVFRRVVPIVGRIRNNIEKIYAPGSILENLQPGGRPWATAKAFWGNASQTSPDLVKTAREIQRDVTNINRLIGGGVGTQTEQDIQRALAGMVKLETIPDTKRVAFDSVNGLMDIINLQMGAILGKSDFRVPTLAPLTDDDEEMLKQFRVKP